MEALTPDLSVHVCYTQSKAASRLDFTTTTACFVEALADVCLVEPNRIEKYRKQRKKAKNSVKYKLNQNSSTAKQTKDAAKCCKIISGRSRSQNRAVFTGKHQPHGTGVLRVDEHPHTQRQPHAVAATTHDFLTDGVPEEEDREDVTFQAAAARWARPPSLRWAHLRQVAKALRALRWRTWVG